MSAQELDQDPINEAGLNARLKWFVLAAAVVTQVLLVASVWRQWRVIAIIMGVFILQSILNMALAQPVFSKRTRASQTIRMLGNMLCHIVYGHFTRWLLPVWVFLTLESVWAYPPRERLARYVQFGSLLVVVLVAVLEKCPPLVPLVFIVLGVLFHVVSSARMTQLRQVLERLAHRHQELSRAHEELAQAHDRGREQDRLSSLGMLAAGMAHEINNPLSYVKSNVNALYRDLRNQKELSPELGEYVTEVLPETLDGIHRIATIVSDLRRFARRDPEPTAEYDLNAEVRAALRIAGSRIGTRCEVELDLGSLPRLMGRPQQMAQVVINLLINAAQAIPDHGRISISTRQEGYEVVLTVHDTGQGMPPEVQEKIFQPFYSTKALGEGTGMGLAVVHGIVAAHGGRIQVESQPGKGSTFTIYLPGAWPVRPGAGA